VSAEDIGEDALDDPEVLRLSGGLTMRESAHANANFPAQRLARTALVLKDGTRLEGAYMTPRWDWDAPPSEAELRAKFHALAGPVLGPSRTAQLEDALEALPDTGLAPLTAVLAQPIS